MTHPLVPRVNVWIDSDGETAISIWRIELLEAIKNAGSVASAAEQMRVPYRVAWHKIKEMEQRLGIQLVRTRTGGADKGVACLTPAAETYIRRFHEFRAGIEEWVQHRFNEAFQDVS